MNYKLTLAIIIIMKHAGGNDDDDGSNEEHDNGNNNEEHNTTTSSCCCLGGIENMIIYRPLPSHAGSSYDVVSWGTVLTCDTVSTMMGKNEGNAVRCRGKELNKKKNEEEKGIDG